MVINSSTKVIKTKDARQLRTQIRVNNLGVFSSIFT
jgi:hypothetical protein